MIVMKFGGTSVGDVEALRHVCDIVRRGQEEADGQGVVVVTSAMKGVTNFLVEAAQDAARGGQGPRESAYERLQCQHDSVLNSLVAEQGIRERLQHDIEHKIRHLRRLLESIAVIGELTPKGADWIAGTGESIMAPVLHQVLRSAGLPAELVDAREVIITDEVFGGAEPRSPLTEERCQKIIQPLLVSGKVVVTGGFIGATLEGVPTTLGRGGSDYTAAIIGAALNASEIRIYTDVSGVKTADPRVVPQARSLRQISYGEMAELSYYGAKVLHPKTVRPAMYKNIALRVLNTFEPDHPGTIVVPDHSLSEGGNIRAVTAIQDMTLIRIEGRGMLGVTGMAARAFGTVSEVHANVLMISQSSSEQSICFVIPRASTETVVPALRQEFAVELERGYIDRIESQSDIVIIAAVGHAIHDTLGIAGKVFTALAEAGINIISIAQGASDAMISMVVAAAEADAGIRALHNAFELHVAGQN